MKAVRTVLNLLAEPQGSYLEAPVSLLTLRRNQPFQEVLSSEVKINYSFGFKSEHDTNKIISANTSPQVLIRKSALLAEMDILRHLRSAWKMRQTLPPSTSDCPGRPAEWPSIWEGELLLVRPGRMAEAGSLWNKLSKWARSFSTRSEQPQTLLYQHPRPLRAWCASNSKPRITRFTGLYTGFVGLREAELSRPLQLLGATEAEMATFTTNMHSLGGVVQGRGSRGGDLGGARKRRTGERPTCPGCPSPSMQDFRAARPESSTSDDARPTSTPSPQTNLCSQAGAEAGSHLWRGALRPGWTADSPRTEVPHPGFKSALLRDSEADSQRTAACKTDGGASPPSWGSSQCPKHRWKYLRVFSKTKTKEW